MWLETVCVFILFGEYIYINKNKILLKPKELCRFPKRLKIFPVNQEEEDIAKSGKITDYQ